MSSCGAPFDIGVDLGTRRAVSGTQAKYRPDIDGLRAVAVSGVVLYHASPTLLPGGFLNVDVFFVISGFLITSILLDELGDGGVSLLKFYERRVRRLWPALLCVVLGTLAAGAVLLLPHELAQLGTATVATMLFASNVYFWMQTGYFAPAADSLPLLHTWSLAVEEQFYLLYPAVLMVLWRLAGRRLAAAVLLLVVVSFAVSAWASVARPGAAFFLAPFRAWELLSGAVLAMLPPARMSRPVIRHALSLIGLAAIALSFAALDKTAPVPGTGALPAVIGTAAVIAAGLGGHTTPAGRLLSWPPIVFIGLFSYPLYLWHWPALTFSRSMLGFSDDPAMIALAIAGALALATATYLWVEMPIRNRTVLKGRGQLWTAAGAATLATSAAALVIVARGGFVWPVEEATRALILANQARAHDWQYPENCQRNFMRHVERVEAIAICRIGLARERKILLWGDSYIEQLFPALSAWTATNGGRHEPLFATSGGCQPTPGLERREQGFACDAFNRTVLSRAGAADVAHVVIGGAWRFEASYMRLAQVAGQSAATDELQLLAVAERNLQTAIVGLRQAGKRVTLVGRFPVFPVSVPAYMARALLRGHNPQIQLTRAQMDDSNAVVTNMLRRVAAATGAEFVDPADALCTASECPYQEGRISLLTDRSPFAAGARHRLLPLIDRLLGGATNGTE